MYINPKYVVLGGVSVVSLAAGAAGGYALAAHRHSSKVDEAVARELELTRAYYTDRVEMLDEELQAYNEPATVSPEMLEMTEAAIQSLKEYSGEEVIVTTDPSEGMDVKVRTAYNLLSSIPKTEHVVVQEDVLVVAKNVFDGSLPPVPEDFDIEADRENRDPTIPYVITEEEFLENAPEYEQTTVTYFEADDVLADTRDQPIDDTDGVVGDPNLLRFGHGTKDRNTVFVRNERLEMDFEISRSSGSFAEEVHGFVRHSQDRHKRDLRFRGDDE